MIRIVLLSSLILIANVLAGCDSKSTSGSAPPPPTVTVSHPLQKSITEWDEYTGRFNAVDPAWHFLRDTPQRLQAVLDAYDEWTRPLPGGEIDHPARLYLIDRRGAIREIYALAFFDERQALIDIKTLIEEDDPP